MNGKIRYKSELFFKTRRWVHTNFTYINREGDNVSPKVWSRQLQNERKIKVAGRTYYIAK